MISKLKSLRYVNMKGSFLKKATCSAILCTIIVSAGGIGAAANEDDSLPSAYSSLDSGYVTSVKVQDYNSCWAFAGLATYESFLLRNGQVIDDMSTDHLNIWATPHSDGTGWIREVSTDGYATIAPGYLTSWQGGVFKSEAGDISLHGNLTSDDINTDSARYGITSIKYLKKDDPTEIKRAIMENGGVYSSYSHSVSCMSDDKISYFMPSGYTGGYAGHAIEVIGWDDNYSKDLFKEINGEKPQNDGAWLIKNSWGSSYNSIGGYIWMSYEDAYLFADKYKWSYTLTGYEQIDDNKKLMQNEIYGATYEFKYINSKDLTFLNRFTFDEDYDTIDKVIFETVADGADYSIYYVPDNADNTPDADTAHWTKLYDGKTDYAGYICADIEDFKLPDSTGSIAVSIDTSKTDSTASLGVGEWLTSNDDFKFKNSSRKGESYIYSGGTMTDLMDWYLDVNKDDMGGTFVIKAVAVQDNTPTLLGDANLDGIVNINDVTEIQRNLAEYISLSKTAKANADFNQDGSITIEDCTSMQHYLAEYR